ncbi:hypothetical protein [Lentzea albida]|nr:hypothetical protein [Lentzea albida]
MATALAGSGGIEMLILDPDGDGVLAVPGERALSLNGPIEELHDFAGIPVKASDGSDDTRPGFYIPPERSEWFSRVLARTSAASLLTFVGDRKSARELLTPRQQTRVGSEYALPGTDTVFDTGVVLGGMRFIGTDHVFRFGSRRMEAFSGVLVGLRQLLAEKDFQGYQSALPSVQAVWADRRQEAEAEWGGVIAMDTDGAVLGLRPMGVGQELEYTGPH